ncbi:MerC family mercury resistance protein [Psychrosphaera algicola]|uniref:MerC family mercury resistance protein n=1 Tax=Psychrosphaera algicola TaxID=3023714 RepID=UPI00351D33FA
MRDIAGAWLSFLCVLHCILPVILLSGGVSLGLNFVAEEMHETLATYCSAITCNCYLSCEYS